MLSGGSGINLGVATIVYLGARVSSSRGHGLPAFGRGSAAPRRGCPTRRRRRLAAARPLARLAQRAGFASVLHDASWGELKFGFVARLRKAFVVLDLGQLSEYLLSSPAAAALTLARQLRLSSSYPGWHS